MKQRNSKTNKTKSQNSVLTHRSKVINCYKQMQSIDYAMGVAKLVVDNHHQYDDDYYAFEYVRNCEYRLRCLLITAMYHNQFAKIKDEDMDAYFKLKVSELKVNID